MKLIFSKIYENLIAEWLKTFITQVELQQFGNIPMSSTIHYLASLFDKILFDC